MTASTGTTEKYQPSPYRWNILVIGFLTNFLVVALQNMSMPVLFQEIAADLSLNLVQIGLVWGIVALPGIATSLFGGIAGDYFGPKRVLVVSCFLAGAAGALRGFSDSFFMLLGTMFLFGLISSFIPMITLKACGMWFPQKQLGLASGVLSIGMAGGFLVGSLLSATVFSPLLGSWRNVLLFYGILAMLMTVPWLFSRTSEAEKEIRSGKPQISAVKEGLATVSRNKQVWLYGLAMFGINGCVMGALGYLPLYLDNIGWSKAAADSANAAFYATSLAFTMPIALLSDRSANRRKISILAGTLITTGIGLLFFAQGGWIWFAVCLAGLAGDGFMAVTLASIMEVEGVGSRFSGAALGMVMVFSRLGILVAPPLGNSLADTSINLPFLFWSIMGMVGITGLLLVRDARRTTPLSGNRIGIPGKKYPH